MPPLDRRKWARSLIRFAKKPRNCVVVELALKELERTKTQLKGSLMLGLEGTYGRMNKLAKDELYQGRHVTLQEMVKAIDRISR